MALYRQNARVSIVVLVIFVFLLPSSKLIVSAKAIYSDDDLIEFALNLEYLILQFDLRVAGHLRAIKSTVNGFPRPLLNLSTEVFAKAMDSGFGPHLIPPFDPSANAINYLLIFYSISYVGLTGFGAIPLLQNATSKKLVASLLGVESGQDAAVRALLYERQALTVKPYGAP